MAAIDPRDEQMFPKFRTADIDRLRRFGEVRRHVTGEPLFVTGDVAPGMFVLITGSVRSPDVTHGGVCPPSSSWDPATSSPRWGSCQAGQRWSMFMPLTVWRRCSFRPKTCGP